jgi:putative ABC transport system permease protein
MIAVALKGLAGRKIRALLTAFAIVIGVSMVSGTFILTDTMQKTFDGLFKASSAQTDAVIQGKSIVDFSSSGAATVPESLLAKIRALPEVGSAGGAVSPEQSGVADILDSKGEKVGLESIGGSYDPANARFSPLKLKTGQWAEGPEQVVIDAGTAEKEHYAIGDPVVISSLGEKHTYRLTGTASFGDTDSLGFATVAAWDLPTAQKVLHREGAFDLISVAAKDGTSPAELVKALQPLVPGTLQVKDSAKQAAEDAKDLNSGMDFLRYILLGFAGIALFVGAFVIFNTLSITVAQRTREFATLRTLGASRKQVMRSVRLEGLVLGLIASVIGLVLGLGIAKGMIALFGMLGFDLPDGGTVFAAKTAIVSILLGTGITLLASILPARKATRVPPIAAVREGAVLPVSRLAAHSRKLGVGVLLGALAAISAGLFAAGGSTMALVVLLGGGVLALLVAIALLAPHVVKPLARAVGWPAKRAGGVAGELAGANSIRHPGRTASTAAALMVGLTLVTVVAVLGAGIRDSQEGAVKKQLTADYVVDGKQQEPFAAKEGDALARVPGVKAASHVRSELVLVGGDEMSITGIDPATIAQFYRFQWAPGSERALDRLGAGGAVVTDDYAKSEKLKVGSGISITTPTGDKRRVAVSGIYEPHAKTVLGDVSISQKGFDDLIEQPRNSFTFLAGDDRVAPGLEDAVDGFTDATYHTGAAYPKDSTKDMAMVLAMLYVLLGFSVIVSLFGMVNTLVLSVFERTRELGMLRTIGMTRRQARRMIRHESVITSMIGAVMGLGLGVFLAAVVTLAISADGMTFVLPLQTLAGFTLVAILAGIAAAVLPARRASRLDVLKALQYE